MAKSNKPDTFTVYLVFATALLGTASTTITAGKHKEALLSVLTGGVCILIVGLVTRLIHWLSRE